MPGKRGRKCSVKTCQNYQRIDRHLSFFRYPKNHPRCIMWLKLSDRMDLINHPRVYDERICQKHFVGNMFTSSLNNRLEKYAVPTLFLPAINKRWTHPTTTNESDDLLYRAALIAAKRAKNTPSLLAEKGRDVSIRRFVPEIQPRISQQIDSHQNPIQTIAPIIEPIVPASVTVTDVSAIITQPTQHPNQIFTTEQECQLAGYVRETAVYYSGLSSREIRVMAYVYGVCNSVQMPMVWMLHHVATHDWCAGFVKRHNIPDWMVTGIPSKSKVKYAEECANNSNITTIEFE